MSLLQFVSAVEQQWLLSTSVYYTLNCPNNRQAMYSHTLGILKLVGQKMFGCIVVVSDYKDNFILLIKFCLQ